MMSILLAVECVRISPSKLSSARMKIELSSLNEGWQQITHCAMAKIVADLLAFKAEYNIAGMKDRECKCQI